MSSKLIISILIALVLLEGFYFLLKTNILKKKIYDIKMSKLQQSIEYTDLIIENKKLREENQNYINKYKKIKIAYNLIADIYNELIPLNYVEVYELGDIDTIFNEIKEQIKQLKDRKDFLEKHFNEINNNLEKYKIKEKNRKKFFSIPIATTNGYLINIEQIGNKNICKWEITFIFNNQIDKITITRSSSENIKNLIKEVLKTELIKEKILDLNYKNNN